MCIEACFTHPSIVTSQLTSFQYRPLQTAYHDRQRRSDKRALLMHTLSCDFTVDLSIEILCSLSDVIKDTCILVGPPLIHNILRRHLIQSEK